LALNISELEFPVNYNRRRLSQNFVPRLTTKRWLTNSEASNIITAASVPRRLASASDGTTGAPLNLAAGQGAMSEFDPDDYVDKAAHLKQPHNVSAAWVVMVLVAVLFIGLNRFLGGATEVLWQPEPAGEASVHHMVLHHHGFEPSVIPVHPGDRIILGNEDADVHALTVVGHEEILEDEIIEPETSFEFTVPAFLEPGEYELICSIHRGMEARIVMTGASGAAPPPNYLVGRSAAKSTD